MKVREVIGELLKADPDTEVVIEINTTTYDVQEVFRTNYVSLKNEVVIKGEWND